MKMIKNLGEPFTRRFEGIYPAIAAKHDVLLIPFFLEGVAGDRQLNQADGIHPTPEGYRKVADHVYPYVVEAIRKQWRFLKKGCPDGEKSYGFQQVFAKSGLTGRWR